MSTTTSRIKATSAEILANLPPFLQPGVSDTMHQFLRAILLVLNSFLGYCAVVGVFRPHFEVLFVLSLCLSGCYIWFMFEISKIHAEAEKEKSRETEQQATTSEVDQKKEK